jgi:hypothetical protein
MIEYRRQLEIGANVGFQRKVTVLRRNRQQEFQLKLIKVKNAAE